MSSEKNRSRVSLRSVMVLNAALTLVVLFAIFHGIRLMSPEVVQDSASLPPEPPIWLPIIVLFGALICVAGSMGFVLVYLRSKARGAEQVLERLRRGEFSARLPAGVLEDLGGLTSRFNEMASEIESLVLRLRTAERNRIEIIQDIGHDLRHPLASIRVLAETLETRGGQLTADQSTEIRELLRRESIEIEDMLEDLLTLASLEDPKLVLESDELSLIPEVEEFLERFRMVDPDKKFIFNLSDIKLQSLVLKTDRRLFFRMLRNAVENARRFAKSSVTIEISEDAPSQGLRIDVLDDGAGFSSKAIEWFVRRERHMAVPGMATGRGAGLGLGSFVMRKIADLLRVQLEVGNAMNHGIISGGRLRLTLNS